MSIHDVQILSERHGEAVVPPLSDYHVLSEKWEETEFRSFGGEATSYTGGFWTGEPGAVRFESWPYNEICVILAGRVALVDEHGDRLEFGPGEAFHVPQGFRGDWVTVEPTIKVFVAVSK